MPWEGGRVRGRPCTAPRRLRRRPRGRASRCDGSAQRPVAEPAFSEPSGPFAWKSLPAWAVVATSDKAAGTDVTRSLAERAAATITEADGSHAIMVSRPETVAEVTMTAAAAVDRPATAAVRAR